MNPLGKSLTVSHTCTQVLQSHELTFHRSEADKLVAAEEVDAGLEEFGFLCIIAGQRCREQSAGQVGHHFLWCGDDSTDDHLKIRSR